MANTYYVIGVGGNDTNGGSNDTDDAWATIEKASDTATAGDHVYIKKTADYGQAAQLNFDTNSGSTTEPIIFEGYSTTPGDGVTDSNRPTIKATESLDPFVYGTQDYLVFKHIIFDGDGNVTGTWGVDFAIGGADNIIFEHCYFETLSSRVLSIDYMSIVTNCEVTGGTYALIEVRNQHCIIAGCYLHDTIGSGVQHSNKGGAVYGNLCVNCGDNLTEAAIRFDHNASSVHVIGNIVDGGVTGMRLTNNCWVSNNIIINASGVALENDFSGVYGNNAFWGNGTNRSTSGTDIYTSSCADIVCSSNPFIDSDNRDYTLNNLADGGALCQSVGFPLIINGQTNYLDIGTLQKQPTIIHRPLP